MPKKQKKKHERHKDFSNEEWRDWGEKFGKRMAKRGADFGEEVSQLGERFGRHMEKEGKEWGHKRRNWWIYTFGLAGPFIGSIMGIIFLVIGIFILNFLNFFLGSGFIASVSNFLYTNIGIFFAIFLFSGYNEYLSRMHQRSYWTISPITTGISVVIAFWILAWVITLINTVPKIAILTTVSNFLFANLLAVFVIIFVLGYAFVVIKKILIESMRY